MDTLDRFRITAQNITQRFEQLQRAVAAGDKAAEHCFSDLIAKLNTTLCMSDRFVVRHSDGSWETTNMMCDAKRLVREGSVIEDILTKY